MSPIIIYIIGGFTAGIVTGLVGLSAATIIAPLFITVLGMDPYTAIGIALASDVLASALSAFNYIQHKNISLKSAAVMGTAVITFTILGSIFSRQTDPNNLGGMINIFVVFLGLRFLIFPVKDRPNSKIFSFTKSKLLQSLIWGTIIGMISGYFGAGGGLSMLAVLTIVLGYDLKTGVGTSVFIMTGTAFVGAAAHIIIGGTLWLPLVITCIAALIGANLSSLYANKVDTVFLNKIIGTILVIYGVTLVTIYFI